MEHDKSLLQTTQNTGDLGGYHTQFGGLTRSGVLLRSDVQNDPCSCVKRIDASLPKAWCYCTLGYTKRLMESVLDRSVDVELISSVKQGDPECRIRITVLE